MAYADYEYYTATYGGRVIPAADFPRLAERASAYIDKTTFGRITDVTDKIRNCCCEIAEFYQRNGTDGALKSAESVGGYSVSYASSGVGVQEALNNICHTWLSADLLYRGVNPCSHQK